MRDRVIVQNNPVNKLDPFGLREITILDWIDPLVLPFVVYDFRKTMKDELNKEYNKTGNKCLKELSDNYSRTQALIDR